MCCDSCSGENNEIYRPPQPTAPDDDTTESGTGTGTGAGTGEPKPGPSGGGGSEATTKPSRPERESNEEPEDSSGGPGPSHPPFGPFQPGRRRRIRRLWCQTGYDVAVYPNGKVRGTKSPRNKYGLLEFEAAGLDGQIRIKGLVTGFYVTMTPKGRVHGQPAAANRGTVWIETKVGSGTAYHSLLSLDYAHHGYYLGLKKSGKPKSGPKTFHPYPQKAISFLSRIVAEDI